MYNKYIKRFFDIVLSLICLIVFAIPNIIIMIAIAIEDDLPTLFGQKRIGINDTIFNMLKFRSMRSDAPHDVATHLLENPEQYILKVGKIIRKTSLDELPQMFNILKGDMSFVGPRPALWNQYDLIEARDKNGANTVRPGLTGWAQINGRDELDIQSKADFDGEYAKNISFKLDCKIILITFLYVIKQTGVVEGGTGIAVKMKEYSKENLIDKK